MYLVRNSNILDLKLKYIPLFLKCSDLFIFIFLQPNDPVVALHPDYSFSYAPGIVLKVYQNLEMKIRFYDGQVLEEKLPREEIYKLTQEKYEHDVNYIVQCETRWVEQAVVARDDRMGSYHLGNFILKIIIVLCISTCILL